MTRAGRRPNPDNIRQLKGKTRRVPQAPSGTGLVEPRWADELPGKADATVRSDCARNWRLIVGDLEGRGYLSPADTRTVIDACMCQARLRQCERMISREGIVTLTERGQVLNRHVTAANGYRNALARHITDLGLSPSARARLAVPTPEEPGGAARLLT